MKSKFLTVIMAVTMILTCMPTTIYAEENPTYFPTDAPRTDGQPLRDNCELYGIEGTFAEGQQDALNLLNEIRKEAYEEGLVGAYVPLKWSSDMENIARIRAAEASLTMGHIRTNVRTNGQDNIQCFEITSNGYQSSVELLGFNSEDTMISAIEDWSSEKEKAEYKADRNTVNHYSMIINPIYKYAGVGTFLSDETEVTNSTACELRTGSENFDKNTKTDMKPGGPGVQILEINTSLITIKDDWEPIDPAVFKADPVLLPKIVNLNQESNPIDIGQVSSGSTINKTTEVKTPECTHSAVAKITKSSTCTATGIRTYTCSKCAEKIKDETIAKIAHAYTVYGRCARCGTLENNVSTAVPSMNVKSISRSKTSVTVKWKKNKNVKGYQIRYSTDSSMKGAKAVTIKSYKTTSKKISRLKRKTSYYVQIRASKPIGGITKYSLWSAVKKVTTK